MSAIAGYMALGTFDPVTDAFTETSYPGYAQRPVAFDLDAPLVGGAVDSGGDVLRNSNAPVFAAPTSGVWPAVNAFAVRGLAPSTMFFAARLWGQAINIASVGPFSIPLGRVVLTFKNGLIESQIGGRVRLIGACSASVIGGAVILIPASAGVSLGGTLPTS